MTRRAPHLIRHLANELAAADAAGADRYARDLVELARSLRRTLPAASRHDPVGVIERLLARRSNRFADDAERAAARGLLRLDASERARLAQRLEPRLHALVPALLAADSPEDREAGLALVGHARSWACVPQAAGIVGRHSPRETDLALDAIAACAASLSDPHQPEPAAFERAIAAVLDAATHHGTGRERRVLAVALMLLTPPVLAGRFGRAAESWLDDAPQAVQLALRSSLRTLEGPLGVGRALELLVRPDLRRAAAERLASAAEPDEHRALLHRAHLGRRPLRRTALRSRLEPLARTTLADGARSFAPAPLGAVEARALPGWLDLLAIPSGDRTPLLEPLLAHADAAARFAAVLHAGSELRLDQSLDASEPVAHAAALRLAVPSRTDIAAGLAEPAARRLLHRSPHGSVQRVASRLPCEGGFGPIALVSMRRDLARQPSALVSRLADRAAAGDIEAIALAARFELADQLLDVLAGIIDAEEPRAAASAARALASARAARADDLLLRCLEHGDPRVRANAIEASAARARRWKRPLPPLRLDDPHHRPASTSIRVQIVARRADEQTPERVQQLLTSSEGDRRAAGLWLTERTAAELKPVAGPRWAEIAARVAESARRGDSARERRRATRCARRMLAVIQQ